MMRRSLFASRGGLSALTCVALLILSLLKTELASAKTLDHVGLGRKQTTDSCLLYSDGLQEPGSSDLDVTKYEAIHLNCDGSNGNRIATRSMVVNGQTYYLFVHPEHLTTSIEKASCYRCASFFVPFFWDRFHRAVEFSTRLSPADQAKKVVLNSGITRSAQSGSGAVFTGDLCPSHLPLQRSFLSGIKGAHPSPIALSVSGLWLLKHDDDFTWLKNQVEAHRFDIIWTNHSYHHPFNEHVPIEETFMLTKGLDINAEVLDTEKLLVRKGVTPSVFFRYPGLATNSRVNGILRDLHVIVVGADAWIAKNQMPKDGSIMLVHPNGNEDQGLTEYSLLQSQGKIPSPLKRLNEAPL